MKKLNLLKLIIPILSFSLFAQKAELLDLRAKLCCCKTKSCNTTKGEIKRIIETYFNPEEFLYESILIDSRENIEWIEKNIKQNILPAYLLKKKLVLY